MGILYNDNERFVCEWLHELIAANELPRGDVACNPIQEISPDDLAPYTECHFFAGIGGWPLALQLAGWPTGREVWTGSCPCQPFSAAGKRQGTDDPRHLWPEFLRLIAERRPATVFGEQVASADGRVWLAGVRADLEALGYAVGAADLCAAGCGAPHIRQRLFWVADNGSTRLARWEEQPARQERPAVERDGSAGRLALSDGWNPGAEGLQRGGQHGQQPQDRVACADGRSRRVKPGIQPLAYGVPSRVGTLRGAGNAIVPQVAAEFIQAFLDTER